MQIPLNPAKMSPQPTKPDSQIHEWLTNCVNQLSCWLVTTSTHFGNRIAAYNVSRRLSKVHREKVLSRRARDAIARRNPVGGRVIEALDAIWQEAIAHGVRPGGPPPRRVFFSDLTREPLQYLIHSLF